MKLKYDMADYTFTRLNRTVVRVGDIPVYVMGKEDGIHYSLIDLTNGKYLLENILLSSIKELDISPVPLGYVNIKELGHTYYISRNPIRKYKQGLAVENIICSNFGVKDYIIRNSSTIRDAVFPTKHLGNCILGLYPPFNECINILMNKQTTSIAFNRMFAISSTELAYKGLIVGSVDLKKKKITLLENFKFLKEELLEAMKC